MEDSLYREIILEHWNNPQNYGVVAGANIDEEGFNTICGDRIHVTGKVRNNRLQNIAFTAEGCSICKSSASIFTEYIKGMHVPEVLTLTESEALAQLGIELTPARTKCALLVYTTTKKALRKML